MNDDYLSTRELQCRSEADSRLGPSLFVWNTGQRYVGSWFEDGVGQSFDMRRLIGNECSERRRGNTK